MADEKNMLGEFPQGEEAQRLLATLAQAATAAGAIPAEHKGFYQPSAKELREGFRVAHMLNVQMAEAQTKQAESDVESLFIDKGRK
jgi:hypothetical protein